MRTGKYYLGLAIIIGILCGSVLGEVETALPSPRGELPPTEDKSFLLAQPNPTLRGIRQLYIVIFLPDAEPNKDGLNRKDLEAAVEGKISQSSIKIARAIQREHILRSLDIPELKININMLKIEEPNQYVFHIETSLAKKVYLTRDTSQRTKVDLWKTEPIMQAVSVEDMPAVITSAVLGQIEEFIHAYLAANPLNKRPSDSNDISKAAEESAQPSASPRGERDLAEGGQVESTAESTPASSASASQRRDGQRGEPAEYKYVASKSSKVFHKPDCIWARRIKPENLVYYSSRDEAINAGKRPCKQCNP
jgi:hypothetical protein